MNEKKTNTLILTSVISGLILLILGVLLMFLLNIVYFLGLSFIGVFFLIIVPINIVKKNSYDLKETLESIYRNTYQELIFNFLNDNSIILSPSDYEINKDLGLTNSKITFKNYNNDALIVLILNTKKIKLKYKNIKEIRLFQNFSSYKDVISFIKEIVNNNNN